VGRKGWNACRRLVLLAAGLALGLGTLAIASAGRGFSIALSIPFGSIALLSAGWSLMVAGMVLEVRNQRLGMSVLLYGAGCAWFLSEWNNPATGSATVFSVGLASYAACPAVVAHVGLAYPAGRIDSPPARLVVISGYTITVVLLGMAPAMFLSPESHGCTGCAANLLLVNDQPEVWLELNRWGVQLATAWAVAALVAIVWRLLRASGASRRSLGFVSLCALGYLGCVLAYYVGSLDRGFLGNDSSDRRLWLIQATTLGLLSVAVLVDVIRARLTHRALTKLVTELAGAVPVGHLRDAMAARLGDPSLVVGYPVDGGSRFVDAMAHDVELPPPDGRTVTPLRYGGTDLAVLVHRRGLLGSREMVDDLASAVHLGLENEHLHAQALAQLAALRSSGARIVAEGDEERRRLERDLHDGAQQRLVGLALALRLLRSQATSSMTELAAAERELHLAIAELRQLARGLYPVTLTDRGLAAALTALAEARHLRVESAPDERLPAVVESTAYLLVARVSESHRTSVRAVAENALLVMDVTADGQVAELGEITDRVRTLEGSLDVTRSVGGATAIRLSLPLDRS
jgi:signal transduction histidine kinase